MPMPVDGTWRLTFDDEFNGTSINKNIWGTNWLGTPGTITKPVASEELGVYDPAQVSVSGGNLHLNTIARPATVNGTTYDYRGGLVHTHDGFSQSYGYFEARIKLPANGGKIANWPAFWLDGNNWPADGEIDVMEGLGGEAAYHTHSPSGGPGKSVTGDFTGWHIFGVHWEPGRVSFYYDNLLVGQLTGYNVTSPNFLVLNLGISPESVQSPQSEMLVDWVHVYSKEAGARAVTPQAGYSGPGGNTPPASTATGTTPPPASQVSELNGTELADTLNGTAAVDRINGKGGSDTLRGFDGNDVLTGGAGHDVMAGGTGRDVFDFNAINESLKGAARDLIADFQPGTDDIDLRTIDASSRVAGDQNFTFIGKAGFSHKAGELRYAWSDQSGTANDRTIVSGDANGDGLSDFQIALKGLKALGAGDFIL